MIARIFSKDHTGALAAEAHTVKPATTEAHVDAFALLVQAASNDEVDEASIEFFRPVAGTAAAAANFGGIEYVMELDFETVDGRLEVRRFTGAKAACFNPDGTVDTQQPAVFAIIDWISLHGCDSNGVSYVWCVGGRRAFQGTGADELRGAVKRQNSGSTSVEWYPEHGADVRVMP